jgi:hypothetical protein
MATPAALMVGHTKGAFGLLKEELMILKLLQDQTDMAKMFLTMIGCR